MTPLTVQLVPQTTFLAGDAPIATGDIPDGYSLAKVAVARTWFTGPVTPTDVIRARLEASVDGGGTWLFLGEFTMAGGVLYPGQRSIAYTPPVGAVPVPESSIQLGLPAGTARKYRITAHILAALTTAVSVTLS